MVFLPCQWTSPIPSCHHRNCGGPRSLQKQQHQPAIHRTISTGVVPPQDYEELKEAGASAIFPPGTVISEAAVELINKIAAFNGFEITDT